MIEFHSYRTGIQGTLRLRRTSPPEGAEAPHKPFDLESFDPEFLDLELETEGLRAERFTPLSTGSESTTCRTYTNGST